MCNIKLKPWSCHLVRSWVLDPGCWLLDPRSKILGLESSVLVHSIITECFSCNYKKLLKGVGGIIQSVTIITKWDVARVKKLVQQKWLMFNKIFFLLNIFMETFDSSRSVGVLIKFFIYSVNTINCYYIMAINIHCFLLTQVFVFCSVYIQTQFLLVAAYRPDMGDLAKLEYFIWVFHSRTKYKVFFKE